MVSESDPGQGLGVQTQLIPDHVLEKDILTLYFTDLSPGNDCA